jgi:hypothetical protein
MTDRVCTVMAGIGMTHRTSLCSIEGDHPTAPIRHLGSIMHSTRIRPIAVDRVVEFENHYKMTAQNLLILDGVTPNYRAWLPSMVRM